MSSIQAPPLGPGFSVDVDANALEDAITDAVDTLARTGRRCDWRSVADYLNVSVVFLMRVCTIEPIAVAE